MRTKNFVLMENVEKVILYQMAPQHNVIHPERTSAVQNMVSVEAPMSTANATNVLITKTQKPKVSTLKTDA